MTTSTPPRPAAQPAPARTVPAATFREPAYPDGQPYAEADEDDDGA